MARDSSLRPDFSREGAAILAGARHVCGIDEAGRGPLAGPVVAAAVILDPLCIPEGLGDSKTLSEAAREKAYGTIMASAIVATGIADVSRIDRDNILAATLWAMAGAVAALAVSPCLALVDGNRAPHLPVPVRTVVRGDALSLSIAAASIVAKVTRDRIMRKLDRDHPGYGFARHKGYGTAAHLAALARLGPSPQHRMSFAPVANSMRNFPPSSADI